MAISVLIHTRNEQAFLPECLESAQWADEIVVADMQSDDDTRAIAERYGATVIEVPMAPVVEPVRNQAISRCRCEWILIVDADERVSPGLARAVKALGPLPDVSAYRVPRRNYFLDTWLEFGFWPDYQTRFVKRGSVHWPEHIHASPRIEGACKEMPPDPDAALEHPGYGNNLDRFIDKLTRYAPIEARVLVNHSPPAPWPYMMRRPAAEFYGRYFKSGAWKHGAKGLAWSILMAMYQTLIAIHYWNVVAGDKPDPVDPKKLKNSVRFECARNSLSWLRR